MWSVRRHITASSEGGGSPRRVMIKGLFYIACSSVAYGIMPVFSTQLLRSGMNSQSVVVFRFAFAAAGALAALLLTRTPMRVSGRQLWQLVLFGLFGYGATAFLLTSSYQYLPIGLCTMFHFSYPILVTVIMAVLYRERVSPGKAAAIVLAAGGIVLMAEFSARLHIAGVLLALSSGLTYAIFVVANRKSAFSTLPPLVIVFYTTAALTVFFAGQSALTGKLIAPSTPFAWLCTVMVGLLCSLFALCMLNMAIRTIGATNAAIGNLLEPLTSLAAGAIIYGDRVDLRTGIGCGLVFAAVLLVVLSGRK